MRAIKIKNLSKSFMINSASSRSLKNTLLNVFGGNRQKLTVLDDISFDIKKGEFIGIIGQNGCGKSTLLKILAGIIQPDSGSININGKVSPFLELGVGFQEELSALDNIYLYGSLLGMTKSQIDEKLNDIISFSELEKFINTPLKHFSSGMYVRLAFSVAIHADFNILLLDEVLAVGDVSFQQKCFQKFEEIKEKGKTIVFVSHNLKQIVNFSDKVLWMESGKIKSFDNVKKIVNRYIQSHVFSTIRKIENSMVSIRSVNCDKNIYKTKEDIKITIKYQAMDVSKSINFGLGIYSDNLNEYIFGFNTSHDKIKIKPFKNGTIETILRKQSLLPGNYYINVVCFDKDEIKFLDFVGQAFKFEIIGNQKYRGLVEIDHSWIVK